ncbi:MAG: FkbM family methyltransferase [Arenicellales bacterium]
MKNHLKAHAKKIIAQRMHISDHEMNMLLGQTGVVNPITDEGDLISLIHKLSPVMGDDMELIRFGPNGDGGYLIPDDLIGVEACFSPGVNLISGFEKDCANTGMKVFLADKSVDQAAESDEMFHFTKKYVGVTTSEDCMTIDDWVSSSLPENPSDLLLQIDIEGAEYEVFLGMSDCLMRRFRIIVAEFHGLEKLWSRHFFQFASKAFEKLLQTHTCVHIHPNNCCGYVQKNELAIPSAAEFTFLRSERISNPSLVDSFPHPLDCNNTSKPFLALPKCWYSER